MTIVDVLLESRTQGSICRLPRPDRVSELDEEVSMRDEVRLTSYTQGGG